MKFHDFSPFYRSGEGIRSKVSGDRLIDNPAVADAQGGSGASYSFDGTDDYVTVGANDEAKFPTQPEISVELWADLDASVSNHGLTYATGNLFLTIQGGVFSARNFSTAGATTHQSNWTLTSGWHHYAVTITNSTSLTFYVDGVAQGTATCVAGLDASTNGGFDIGRGYYSGTTFTNGQISQARLHNRALSAAEVRAAYNGQAVPFEYVGGSQTEVLSNPSFTSGDTGWSKNSGWTIVDQGGGDYEGVATSCVNHNVLYQQPTALQKGKTYRATYTVTNLTAGGFNWRMGSNNEVGTTRTEVGTYTEDIVCPNDDSDILGIQAVGTTTGRVDDVSLIQIGCVAEYLPSGINATQWVDTSGNGLHGTTSTATAVNHEVGAITATGVVEVNNGIKFPATAVASADSNTLDDYEEGAWTAALAAGSSGTITINDSYKTGEYIKVGRLVYFNCHIRVASVSSPVGELRVTGLPFSTESSLPERSALTVWGTGFGSSAGESLQGYISEGSSTIRIQVFNSGSLQGDSATGITSSSEFNVTGTYYA